MNKWPSPASLTDDQLREFIERYGKLAAEHDWDSRRRSVQLYWRYTGELMRREKLLSPSDN